MKMTGPIERLKIVESTTAWRATAKSHAKDKRIKDIEIFVYFNFNVERKEITIKFQVTNFDTESSVSDEEKIRIQEKFDAMKDKKEQGLMDALDVYGAWAPNI